MEPFRIVVDRYVRKNIPLQFEKDEKHAMWSLLQQTVLIDGTHQSVVNAIKIHTRSVFEAINDGDPSQIKFFEFDDDDGYEIFI